MERKHPPQYIFINEQALIFTHVRPLSQFDGERWTVRHITKSQDMLFKIANYFTVANRKSHATLLQRVEGWWTVVCVYTQHLQPGRHIPPLFLFMRASSCLKDFFFFLNQNHQTHHSLLSSCTGGGGHGIDQSTRNKTVWTNVFITVSVLLLID